MPSKHPVWGPVGRMLAAIPTATADVCRKNAANVHRVADMAAWADDTRAWNRLVAAEKQLLDAAEEKERAEKGMGGE